MKAEGRPIRVTIVDVLGVFVPGMVWLILLITMAELAVSSHPQSLRIPPVKTITEILGCVPDCNVRELVLSRGSASDRQERFQRRGRRGTALVFLCVLCASPVNSKLDSFAPTSQLQVL